MVTVAGGPSADALSNSNSPQSSSLSFPSLFQFSRRIAAWIFSAVVMDPLAVSSVAFR